MESGRRLAPGRIDWAPVQEAVETTEESLAAIARRFGLKHGTVTQQVSRKAWLRPYQTEKKERAQQAALNEDASLENWMALIGNSIDAMMRATERIEKQMGADAGIETLVSSHRDWQAANERNVRIITQFLKLKDRRAEAALAAEEHYAWGDPISALERELFERAGYSFPDKGEDQGGGA
ncbi:MAG: hypothetical protein IT548_09510 [Alphaproteobacteria bacterium]|nr:hypothetical protein [Alphaproteobacteria bacterium]